MLKTHGTLRLKNTPQRRSRFIRSMLLQTILQCLTATGVIVTYHYISMPQIVKRHISTGGLMGTNALYSQHQ